MAWLKTQIRSLNGSYIIPSGPPSTSIFLDDGKSLGVPHLDWFTAAEWRDRILAETATPRAFRLLDFTGRLERIQIENS